jgi:hypothetical protein
MPIIRIDFKRITFVKPEMIDNSHYHLYKISLLENSRQKVYTPTSYWKSYKNDFIPLLVLPLIAIPLGLWGMSLYGTFADILQLIALILGLSFCYSLFVVVLQTISYLIYLGETKIYFSRLKKAIILSKGYSDFVDRFYSKLQK